LIAVFGLDIKHEELTADSLEAQPVG
jgi:hypothetical protein